MMSSTLHFLFIMQNMPIHMDLQAFCLLGRGVDRGTLGYYRFFIDLLPVQTGHRVTSIPGTYEQDIWWFISHLPPALRMPLWSVWKRDHRQLKPIHHKSNKQNKWYRGNDYWKYSQGKMKEANRVAAKNHLWEYISKTYSKLGVPGSCSQLSWREYSGMYRCTSLDLVAGFRLWRTQGAIRSQTPCQDYPVPNCQLSMSSFVRDKTHWSN